MDWPTPTAVVPSPGAGPVPALALSRQTSDPPPNQTNTKPKDEYRRPVDDGRQVGFVLLAVSLVIATWLFTIPPSFRRAYLCPSDYFSEVIVVPESEQRECIPLQQWFANVGDYYRNGGGVQWDFSIDPQTVEDNQAFLDAVSKALTSE